MNNKITCDHLNTSELHQDNALYIECLDCSQEFSHANWLDFVSEYATEQDAFNWDHYKAEPDIDAINEAIYEYALEAQVTAN